MSDSVLLLYHGSETIIEKPVFGYGNSRNDYGKGFYCTEDPELAKEWACKNNSPSYANKYSLDTGGLNILDLNNRRYCVLEWITVLVENRTFELDSVTARRAKEYLVSNFHLNLESVDIMKGWRADDSYFSFASGFLENTVDIDTLRWAMRLGNLGNQVVIRSKRAFDRLNFEGYESADNMIYYPLQQKRDAEARRLYRERAGSMDDDSIILADLVRGTVSKDDTRLQ